MWQIVKINSQESQVSFNFTVHIMAADGRPTQGLKLTKNIMASKAGGLQLL